MPVSDLTPEHRRLLADFCAYENAVMGLAAPTIGNHRVYLEAFLRWWQAARPHAPVTAAGTADLAGFLVAEAARGLAARTRRGEVAALRRLYAWLVLTGAAVADPAAALAAPRVGPPHNGVYAPAEVAAILDHTATLADVRGRQRHAIVATLRCTGMRSGELRTLRQADLDLAAGRARVVGKGSRERTVLLPPALRPVLAQFLEQVRPELPPSPLLLANAHPFVTTALGGFGQEALAREVELAGIGAGVPRPAPPAQVAAHLRHRAGPGRRRHPRGAAAARPRQHRLDGRLHAPGAGRPAGRRRRAVGRVRRLTDRRGHPGLHDSADLSSPLRDALRALRRARQGVVRRPLATYTGSCTVFA